MALALALALALLICGTNTSALTVQYLPGFEGPLPFNLQTGYVGVGESENNQLFYYFVKSERNPEKDPLLLWLTGGPGCSAWFAISYDIGPLNYKIEPYGGLPSLVLNPYSWTKVSSVIFVDSPVGTGFSYMEDSTTSKTGDSKQIHQLAQFFKKWLVKHPDFTSNPVYIAGDSYSGIIVPALVQQLLNEIDRGTFPHINLQGYILGNPFLNNNFIWNDKHVPEDNYKIPFAHGMALISDELYESLKRSCKGEYYKSTDTKCLRNMKAFKKSITGIRVEHILEPDCPLYMAKPQVNTDQSRSKRSLAQISKALDIGFSDSYIPPLDCREFNHMLSGYWANDPRVQKALGVRKGKIEKWKRCYWSSTYDCDILSSFEYFVNLSSKSHRSLIYSGDHDMVVPFLSTQAWIKSLNYSIIDDWRSWIVQGQIAGYTRTYSNRMTFATVKGAGHIVPEYKPKECFAMFQRWIDYETL